MECTFKKAVSCILITFTICACMTFIGQSNVICDKPEEIKKITAVLVKSDGKQIAVLSNKNEIKFLLDKVKEHYIKKNKIIGVNCVKLENKITYCEDKVEANKIKGVKYYAEEIIKKNKSNSTINFIIEGTIEDNVKIDPPVAIKWSNKAGENKIINNGEQGIKLVKSRITINKDKIINKEKVSEKIVKSPSDKIVQKGGTNNAMAFMTPSRGSITSNFGIRWGKMHNGIDIGGKLGDPIYCALEGEVVYSGWQSGYGNVIEVQHENSLKTVYGHCSKLCVKKGSKVSKGQKIGEVGSTGRSTGPHLHFEVRKNGEPVDPKIYLK